MRVSIYAIFMASLVSAQVLPELTDTIEPVSPSVATAITEIDPISTSFATIINSDTEIDYDNATSTAASRTIFPIPDSGSVVTVLTTVTPSGPWSVYSAATKSTFRPKETCKIVGTNGYIATSSATSKSPPQISSLISSKSNSSVTSTSTVSNHGYGNYEASTAMASQNRAMPRFPTPDVDALFEAALVVVAML